MLPNLKIQIFLRGTQQKLLAKAVGTDETALSKIIHGSRLATPAQRRAIAKYLEADENWLFESSSAPRARLTVEASRDDQASEELRTAPGALVSGSTSGT